MQKTVSSCTATYYRISHKLMNINDILKYRTRILSTPKQQILSTPLVVVVVGGGGGSWGEESQHHMNWYKSVGCSTKIPVALGQALPDYMCIMCMGQWLVCSMLASQSCAPYSTS